LVVCSPQWLIDPSYIEIMATPLRLQTPNSLTSSVSSSNNPHAAPSQDASCSSRKTGEKREDGWRRKCCKEGDKICGGPTCGKKRRGQGCVSTRPLGQQGESCGSGLVDASVCFFHSTGRNLVFGWTAAGVERSRPLFWGRLQPFSCLVGNVGLEWL
jgi:hypothetical protein